MKTHKYIFERVTSAENIMTAIHKGAIGKKERREVQKVLADIGGHVEKTQEMLINKTYQPCESKESIVREGARQKERKVTKIDFFPDQVIHWAVILQIGPIITRSAYVYSCGSMPGRGIHYGKPVIERWIRKDRKNTKYCAKLDIKEFYPSLTTGFLKGLVRKLIKDPNMLWLMDKIIDTHKDGAPIGYLTSQWLANFALQPLDFFIKQKLRIKYYMRYMDDMVLFGRNKKELHRAVREIKTLLGTMELKIKHTWQVFRLDKRDLDFMGFRFYRYKTTLRKRLMLRITRHARKIWRKGRATHRQAAAMISYLGWIKHSQTYHVYKRWIIKYVSIPKMKEIVRQYTRGELKKNESVKVRKRRTSSAA